MSQKVTYKDTLEVMITLQLSMDAALEYRTLVHQLFPNQDIQVPLSKFLSALKESKNKELQSKESKAKEILTKLKA